MEINNKIIRDQWPDIIENVNKLFEHQYRLNMFQYRNKKSETIKLHSLV